jgi:hypothetical protein
MVSIESTTVTGLKDVLVAGSNGIATCNGCFGVNPAPSVTSINPGSLGQGATSQTLIINGSQFSNQGGTTPQVAFNKLGGSGVTVNSVVFNNSSQLTANVTLSPSATVGTWDVKVVNPDFGEGVGSGVFTVNPGPRVRSTNPPSAVPGTVNLPLTIRGDNFSNVGGSPTVSFSGGGISPNPVSATFIDAQTLSVIISIASGAAEGPRDITVVNSDRGTGTGLGSRW